MSKLKELTWENHQRAERSEHARKLLKGMTPQEYHRYLYNQWVMYAVLENQAEPTGALKGIETIVRADAIHADIVELENEYGIERDESLLCKVVSDYTDYVRQMENKEAFLAHIYVRHFGDMYGGQMIRKRNPGSGTMYDFENVDELKNKVRAMLNDNMADEANRCFEFAMQLFEELKDE
jgi:heme oxygenase